MNRKALLLTTLAASVVLGGSAGASFARMHEDMRMGMRVPREIIFVRLLEQFDTNKDGKITKEEFAAVVDVKFAEVDTKKDGVLTPGEVRTYREAKWKEWADKRAKNKADAGDDDQAAMPDEDNADDMAMAPDAGPADKAPEGKVQDRQRPPHDRAARMERAMMRHGGMRDVMLFRVVDTDENGQISKEEAVAAGDKFFAWIDVNGDKVISIEDMPDRPFP